jgi:AcrR family transcriptional regulator
MAKSAKEAQTVSEKTTTVNDQNSSMSLDRLNRKKPSEINRIKLTNAAFKIISTQGMEQLTVRNICDLAGLTTGSFYHLYSSKEELVSSYLRYFFSNYKEAIHKTMSDLDALEQILGIYHAYIQCCEDVGVEFITHYYSQIDNPVFDYRHRKPEDAIALEAIGECLRKGQETGLIREDVDLDEVLFSVAAISTGTIYYWCVFKGKIDFWPSVERLLRPYLESLKA